MASASLASIAQAWKARSRGPTGVNLPAGPGAGTVFGGVTAPVGAVGPAAAPAPVAAASPVAASPTGPGSAGWQDSAYTATTNNINTGLTNLQSYLQQQGKALGLNAGINYTGDPTGPGGASGFAIDPNVDVSNPFSKAALMHRSYNQATTGNTNSYAAQGQLYSGALQNAQNQAGFTNQQGQDALLKDFGAQFGGLYQQWLQAQNQANQSQIDAQLAALLRHENDPAALPAGGAAGAVGAPGMTPSQVTAQQAAEWAQAQQPGPSVGPGPNPGAVGPPQLPQGFHGAGVYTTGLPFAKNVGLAPGWGVEYDAAGNAVRFVPPAAAAPRAAPSTDLAALAPFAGDPAVVAYLKALQAAAGKR